MTAIAAGLGVVSLLKTGMVVDGTTEPEVVTGIEHGVTAISTGGSTIFALVGDTAVEYNSGKRLGPQWDPVRRTPLTSPK